MPGWISVSHDKLGSCFIYQQAGEASCAMACIAMVINRIDGSKPTERAIMNILGNARLGKDV